MRNLVPFAQFKNLKLKFKIYDLKFLLKHDKAQKQPFAVLTFLKILYLYIYVKKMLFNSWLLTTFHTLVIGSKFPEPLAQITILGESKVCWLIQCWLNTICRWRWKMWMSFLYLVRSFFLKVGLRQSLNKTNEFSLSIITLKYKKYFISNFK